MIWKSIGALAFAGLVCLALIAGQMLQDIYPPERLHRNLSHADHWIRDTLHIHNPSEKTWNIVTLVQLSAPLAIIIGVTVFRTFRWDRVSISLSLYAAFLLVIFILGIIGIVWVGLIPIESKWAVRIIGGGVGDFASYALLHDPRRTVAPRWDGHERRAGVDRRTPSL